MTSSEPIEHIVHLENDFGGVWGECPCGFFFVGVTDPQDLMAIISEHCAPIS